MELCKRWLGPMGVASILLAAFCLAPGEARAADEKLAALPEIFEDKDALLERAPGLGLSHVMSMAIVYLPGSVVDFEEDPQNPSIAGTGALTIGASFLPIPTLFGSQFGLEADFTLGFPLVKSYFGGIGGNVGLVLQPLAFRYLRLSVAIGGGFNAHGYGYLKPRLAFPIVPDRIEAEATYRWIPNTASNVFDGEDGLEDDGFGEHKLRGSLFVRVGEKDRSRDFGSFAVHAFFEYTRVSGDEERLERFRIRPGDYLTFGLGMAY
ncbi:hypothetical protein [Polyangium spumosum]|uniref:Outer membrane beta-barrel protein n=1 Tax=Polyangium spumosum TaxID=889282 RepID=A0A6N7PRM5_9BACT|nr:hypothetical protein [Polyangium spumosum]MRG94698.1 hypothetical protein [Polyangium spumosum]